MTYGEVRFTYVSDEPYSDREKNAVRAVETALNGLSLRECERVMAAVATDAKDVAFRPYWLNDEIKSK